MVLRNDEPSALNLNAMRDLKMIIELCSAHVTSLHFDGLYLGHCFSELVPIPGPVVCDSSLRVNAGLLQLQVFCGSWLRHEEGTLSWIRTRIQDTICQCKQLRALHILSNPGRRGAPAALPDVSNLLEGICAALPKLATLQWRDMNVNMQRDRGHIWPAFVARTAAESPAGSGLRLLQTEQCTYDAVSTLPASLHVLSICNRPDAQEGLPGIRPLRDRLHLLLAPCAALRELYLLQATPCRAATLDLPLLAAACPALRVLVVYVSILGIQVHVSLHTSMFC